MENKNVLNHQMWLAISIFAASFILFSSCAKKGSPVRAIKQTGSTPMNVVTSDQSINVAGTQKLLYNIMSISFPELSQDTSDVAINSELKTPDNRYIPITTTHKSDGYDSVGVIDDMEKNGTKVDIRARCIGQNCEKYLMLATVVKSGFAVHQLAVVSYSTDCKFNLENLNPAVPNLKIYSSLDDLAARNNTPALKDRETNCPAE